MIRINLLPHRELKRRERRQQFFVVSVAMVVVGLLVALLVHTVIAGYIERQERRNDFLKSEITKLDAQIAEIKRLREQIDALLARKQVIESLQTTRAQAVNVMNEFARRVPDGVYLRSIKQTGPKIALLGYSQSNSRVSALMRSLDESPYLANPGLVEIKAATVNKRRVSDFALNIGIEGPKAEGDQGARK